MSFIHIINSYLVNLIIVNNINLSVVDMYLILYNTQ